MIDWSKRIGGMSRDQLRALRENAIRLGNTDVLELCNVALSKVSATRSRVKNVGGAKNNASVRGFHFVCPQETGVTRNPDGTVWTGTWVVDSRHAERGARIGAAAIAGAVCFVCGLGVARNAVSSEKAAIPPAAVSPDTTPP